MTAFEIYIFVICFIVFVLLTSFSSLALVSVYRQYRRLVELGAEDEALIKEHQRKQQKKTKVIELIDRITSIIMVAVILSTFAFSVYLKATDERIPNGIPSLKVVQSDSMSYANPKNTYLLENNITDRLQVFDLIVVRHIPDEFELELYDIVMYEADGKLIIHRIVDIEEPSKNHPDKRYFVLQGDAVDRPDKIPVYYSQMRGIYCGERIPFVGSFVEFMQSPAGWLCIALIVIVAIIVPFGRKSLEKHINARLTLLGIEVSPQKTSFHLRKGDK